MAGPDAEVARWCAAEAVPCIDVHTTHKYPGFGTHWTPEGQRVITARIADYLHARERGPK